jgi:hypothetical protein
MKPAFPHFSVVYPSVTIGFLVGKTIGFCRKAIGFCMNTIGFGRNTHGFFQLMITNDPAMVGNAVLDGSLGFQAGPTFQCRMMHQWPGRA